MGCMNEKRYGKRRGVLPRFLSDWASIHKTTRALSRVAQGASLLRFTAESVAATSKRRNQENYINILEHKHK